MKVKAWNNSAYHETGAGYGLKISIDDRDKYFNSSWTSVFLSVPGDNREIEINIKKDSFWGKTCRELIKKEIGVWLIKNGYAHWEYRNPPEFDLIQTHDNHFELRKP